MELELRPRMPESTHGHVEVSEGTFGAPYNEALIHQVVTAYLAGGRSGTRAQKTRGEVRGSGAKPWRQKGTGRARAGSRRSPIWRGGGVTFAARPQSHAQKVNRKVYRAAMRSILSELARSARLVVVEDFALAEPKTRALIAELDRLGVDDVLIVPDKMDENLILAARNLPRVDVCEGTRVDPVSLLSFDKILVTVAALRQLEERLG